MRLNFNAVLIALMINPINAQAEVQVEGLRIAARATGQRILVTSTEDKLEKAFTTAVSSVPTLPWFARRLGKSLRGFLTNTYADQQTTPCNEQKLTVES